MQQFTAYRFCKNRACSQTDCLRHIQNAEYNIVIKRTSFECDEKNGYQHLLLHRPKQDEIDSNFQTIITDTVKKSRKKRSDAGKSRLI